ncbi:hypothetical protein EDC04DRAFT_2738218 [Pisolithus marmoratus]|nr:hypothetical protein EDC04DRAFT_2738218 [Pisolithus marmoratus]
MSIGVLSSFLLFICKATRGRGTQKSTSAGVHPTRCSWRLFYMLQHGQPCLSNGQAVLFRRYQNENTLPWPLPPMSVS